MTKDVLKKNTMLLVLISAMLIFQALITYYGRGSLFAPTNITNLIGQNGHVVILAAGMLLCILTGGNIDLSIGSQVALIGGFAGVMMVYWKWNPYIAIIICLLTGLILGAWQAFWIAFMRIPPFIVTLAGMLTFRGISWTVLQGQTISPFPEGFKFLFNNFIPGPTSSAEIISITTAAVICVVFVLLSFFFRMQKLRKKYEVENIWYMVIKLVLICGVIIIAFALLGRDKGIPVVLLLLAAVVLIYNYYTKNTVPGRHLYAMGGNEKASKLSGIDTNKTLFFAYTNMGVLSALAALVCVARFNSASPNAGNMYELDAIGSCFIGGASAYGGVGTIGGAVIGAIFMGVLNNGMSILGIGTDWQRTVKGLVLLAAVIFDIMSKKRKQNA